MRDSNMIALPVAQQIRKRVLLLLICCFFQSQLAWGQHDQPGGQPRGNPFGGGVQRPGGAPFGQGPQGNTKGGAKTPAPSSLKAAPELKIDSVTLPPDFEPPAERDPLFELDISIALPDEIASLKREDSKFKTALNKALRDEASKAAIRAGIRYRLAQMCLSENHQKETVNKLYSLRIELKSLLNGAGSAARDIKPADLLEFRKFVMQEFVKQATPLLDNNLYVRLQIAILLGELEIVEGNSNKNISPEAFTPAFEPLVKVLADEKQPESVKILAVNGLARILRIGTPNVNERTKIAEAMIAEMANSKLHPWYQMRLAGALGAVNLGQLTQPIVIKALKDVVGDSTRTWSVRAEAAKSLGRVPIPAASDPPSVIYAIAKMTAELAKAAQATPKDPQWKADFWNVYLAFVQLDSSDLDATKSLKGGLLNNSAVSGSAKPVYTLIIPMVRSVVVQRQPLTAEQLLALEAWLKGNAPASEQPAGDTTRAAQNTPAEK